MSYARSSGGVGAGDPGLRWGSSSSTCSSSTCLGETSKKFGEKSKGGSKVFVEVTGDSSGKISKTKEVVREERK